MKYLEYTIEKNQILFSNWNGISNIFIEATIREILLPSSGMKYLSKPSLIKCICS